MAAASPPSFIGGYYLKWTVLYSPLSELKIGRRKLIAILTYFSFLRHKGEEGRIDVSIENGVRRL